MARAKKSDKQVTRYTYDDIKEPRTPETGHTMLMDDEYQVVRVSMDNGWKQAINVGKLADEPETVLVDMDPLIDPLLIWSGKKSSVEVPVLPLQRNEIVSESRIKQIIDRAKKNAAESRGEGEQLSLTFADLEKELRESEREKRVEFYTHEEGWRNKIICGDSLHAMRSLLHYENLRGKVQTIFMDPPYGIAYNSNFQQRVDTTSNDSKDQADDVLTIRAFRDTWGLGIHSYLSYLQRTLYSCRDLLTASGSVFVQIGDENVHLVRALLDEVFGREQFMANIIFTKTTGLDSVNRLTSRFDHLLWYAKDSGSVLYQPLYERKNPLESGFGHLEETDGVRRKLTPDERSGRAGLPEGARVFKAADLTKPGPGAKYTVAFDGRDYTPGRRWWGMPHASMEKLIQMGRVVALKSTLAYVRYFDDFPYKALTNMWDGLGGAANPWYVVQTSEEVVARCIAMTSKPGDVVFDPTCGSGTTACAAERLGRRWVTCDTSRVAVNVARNRLLSLVLPMYRLRGASVSSGLETEVAPKVTAKSLTNDLEPALIELVDRPIAEPGAVRVAGPFETLSVGRYTLEDWSGSVVLEGGATSNYIEVVCRLFDPSASTEAAVGLIHAVSDGPSGSMGLTVGPLGGRVTAKQVSDAAQDAMAAGIREIKVLGWAFEANVGEIKSKLESRGAIDVALVMIRPDTLVDGLKVADASELFSPLSLPEVTVARVGQQEVAVALQGVGVYDRKTRVADFKAADSGYVSAWYLDEDYDGDCFIACQMFFDFKKHPNLKSIVNEQIEGHEFTMCYESRPFVPGKYKMCAIKVVDVYGNESTVTIPLHAGAQL